MTFRTRKGAAELVGNVLMILIGISLIAEAFLIFIPISQKKMDQASTSYLEETLSSLADAIEVTALNGGETMVNIETKSRFTNPPIMKLEQDSNGEYRLVLKGQSKAIHYAATGVPLNDFLGPYNITGLTIQSSAVAKATGTLGVNKGVVVTGSSNKVSGGIRLNMEVTPRPIKDPSSSTGKITKIVFVPIPGKSTSSTLPTRISIKQTGESSELVNEGTADNPLMVSYRTLTVGVGFE
ncbi:MAG: hypothetical protein GOV00_00805 [Candidatus Altiarchaeota archaeon]|nr:hypothetical protein [Candidatus Altiarchaeota archaeon]